MFWKCITLSALQDEDITADTVSGYEVTSLTIEDISLLVNSGCNVARTRGCRLVRKLFLESNRPLEKIITSDVLSCFIKFVSMDNEPTLQLAAAWALTEVSSASSWHSQQGVEQSAVPAFITLLGSPHLHIRELAIWTLGNIAGTGPAYREAMIHSYIIPALLAEITPDAPVGYLRYLTWTLINFCRNEYPFPPLPAVQQVLPSLVKLLYLSDIGVLSQACWAISELTYSSNDCIDMVVKTGIVPRLIGLMSHAELSVVNPALRSIGNIVNSSDVHRQIAFDAGVLIVLPTLMFNAESSMQKKSAWILSNISAGPCIQIQQLITCGLLPPLMELLRNGDFKKRREAVWTITSFTSGGTVGQGLQLLPSGTLEAVINLLQVMDSETILDIMVAMDDIILAAEKLAEKEKLCLLEELGSDDQAVFQAAQYLLQKLFSGENPEVLTTEATEDE